MSELTRCNRCTLNSMIATATARGAKVFTWVGIDGWTVAKYTDRDKPSAWFLKLTEDCVC